MKSARSLSVGGFVLVAACSSGSSGNSPDSGPLVGSTPTSVDGGIPCGLLGGGCAPPSECCLANPAAPKCVAQGMCAGASIACSTAKQCDNGQVCCFTYGTAGDAAAMRPYSAQCAEVCPSGDSSHYQLCAATSECVGGGETCVRGPVAEYCMAQSGASPFPDLTADAGSD